MAEGGATNRKQDFPFLGQTWCIINQVAVVRMAANQLDRQEVGGLWDVPLLGLSTAAWVHYERASPLIQKSCSNIYTVSSCGPSFLRHSLYNIFPYNWKLPVYFWFYKMVLERWDSPVSQWIQCYCGRGVHGGFCRIEYKRSCRILALITSNKVQPLIQISSEFQTFKYSLV